MNTLATTTTTNHPDDTTTTDAESVPTEDATTLEPSDTDGTAPVDDYSFDDEPLPPRRERLMGKSTWMLVAGLIAAGGFTAGAHFKSTPAPVAAARAGAGTFAGGAGGGTGARTGGSAGASGTVGTIKLIDGTNIYIQDSQGNVTKVATTPSTALNVTKPGAITDFTSGQTIIVQGAAGADGTIAATAVSSSPARAATAGATASGATTGTATPAAGATAGAATGTGARTRGTATINAAGVGGTTAPTGSVPATATPATPVTGSVAG